MQILIHKARQPVLTIPFNVVLPVAEVLVTKSVSRVNGKPAVLVRELPVATQEIVNTPHLLLNLQILRLPLLLLLVLHARITLTDVVTITPVNKFVFRVNGKPVPPAIVATLVRLALASPPRLPQLNIPPPLSPRHLSPTPVPAPVYPMVRIVIKKIQPSLVDLVYVVFS